MEKEHEAMVLYYRSEINGLLMDSHESGLEIVYVPYMDKIVLIKEMFLANKLLYQKSVN